MQEKLPELLWKNGEKQSFDYIEVANIKRIRKYPR